MTHQRRLRILIGFACASLAMATGVHAQEAASKPANTQLPQQVLPTGAEDAPAAPAAAARAALPSQAAAAAQKEQLERELVEMTSESTAGLVPVKRPDGRVQVNLQDRFMSVAVATPTSDGKTEVNCYTGQAAVAAVQRAEDIAAGKVPKPAPSVSAPAPSVPTVLEEK